MTLDALRERLEAAGIAVREGGADAPQVETFAFEGTRVCTRVPGGRIYCFVVPKVTGPPPGEPGR
jgi:hypothetical protein